MLVRPILPNTSDNLAMSHLVSAAEVAMLIAGKVQVWLIGNSQQVRWRREGGTPEQTSSRDRGVLVS